MSRAVACECVLFQSAKGETMRVRVRRSSGVQVGPEFASRYLAIDWMATRLASEEGHTEPD